MQAYELRNTTGPDASILTQRKDPVLGPWKVLM